jgi:hypothetical protein
MPALLMRPHDFMHVEVQARGDAFDEQSLAQLVEVGERFAAQITRSPHDQMLKLQAAESIPQRGLEYPQQLADPGLPTTDPIANVNCCREAVDQCAHRGRRMHRLPVRTNWRRSPRWHRRGRAA